MSVCVFVWVENDNGKPLPRPLIYVYFPTALHRNEFNELKKDPLIGAKWSDEQKCFKVPASSHEHLEDWAMRSFKFVDTQSGYPFTVGPERDPNRRFSIEQYEAGVRIPWGKWRGNTVDDGDYKWKVPRNAETAWKAQHDKQGFADQFRHEEDQRVFGDEANERGHNCTYSRLLQYASPETMKKVYRLIMLDAHPDRGGSDDNAKVVNAAWDAIKKERGIE
jgi:hypothetical protein